MQKDDLKVLKTFLIKQAVKEAFKSGIKVRGSILKTNYDNLIITYKVEVLEERKGDSKVLIKFLP